MSSLTGFDSSFDGALPPSKRGPGSGSQSPRVGFVAIVGRANVGKSTLMNHLLGEKLAIVSPKPQTTRHRLMGICTESKFQAILLDTPGLMSRPKDALDSRMHRESQAVLAEVDMALMVVEPRPPGTIEKHLVEELRRYNLQALLVINKIDRVKKNSLLPLLETYRVLYPFSALVPVSALHRDGTDHLLHLIGQNLPFGKPLYGSDELTDRTERFLVGELIREQVFKLYAQEIPYDAMVEVEDFQESTEGPRRSKVVIQATIYVNKTSQRGILIGRQGEALKKVGSAAREEIETLLRRPVFLELWVRVHPRWRQDYGFLSHHEF